MAVVAQWTGAGHPAEADGLTPAIIWYPPTGEASYKQAPRNVLIRREDGSQVVRPFRGLRTLPTAHVKLSRTPSRRR